MRMGVSAQSALMAVAWALGQCGDHRAYPALAVLAADKSAPALERLTAL